MNRVVGILNRRLLCPHVAIQKTFKSSPFKASSSLPIIQEERGSIARQSYEIESLLSINSDISSIGSVSEDFELYRSASDDNLDDSCAASHSHIDRPIPNEISSQRDLARAVAKSPAVPESFVSTLLKILQQHDCSENQILRVITKLFSRHRGDIHFAQSRGFQNGART